MDQWTFFINIYRDEYCVCVFLELFHKIVVSIFVLIF